MKKKNFRSFAIIIVIILTGTTAGASDVHSIWEPVNYDLDLRVDFRAEKIYADCNITIKNVTGEPVDEIPLMLYRLLHVTSITDSHNNNLPFVQNVTSFQDHPKLQVNAIQVTLPENIAEGANYTLHLSYEGYMLGYAGEIGAAYRERIEEPFTILRSETLVFPHPGYPTLESLFRFIFFAHDYRATITVPDHLVVANGGELLDKTDSNGLVSYTYRNIKPAWRMDFPIASYEIAEEDGIKIFYFSEIEEGVDRVLDLTKRTLQLFTEWFGPLKDFRNFSIIQIPDNYGAQADVTSILQTADVFTNEDANIGLYHELSHLWHPMETKPFPPCRWNEGLATFLQYLAAEKLDNRPGLVDRMSERLRNEFVNQCKNIPRCMETPFIDHGQTMMYDLSYNKGMVLFHLLFELIGKDAFMDLIGNYYKKYYDTGGSTHDLTAMIKELPFKGVSRFVEEWFYGTESNEYLAAGKSVEEIVRLYQK